MENRKPQTQTMQGIENFLQQNNQTLQHFGIDQLADILEGVGFDYFLVRQWKQTQAFRKAAI